ncbi:MAG: hypothetical protein U0003_02030 [Vampirovibrionales bacterium]
MAHPHSSSALPPLNELAVSSINTAPALQTSALGSTERQDAWWLEPLLVVATLLGFSVYVAWALAQNAHYHIGPYLSPLYSPNLQEYFPKLFQANPWLSPAYLVLWIPLLFRATCYYARRAYYRSFFLTPSACAVGPSPIASKFYRGETRFPFVLLNFHRYFFYFALILVFFHWKHLVEAFFYAKGVGIGVGTLVVALDTIFLTLYVFSCHSWRHLLAGKLNCFTCSAFDHSRHQAYQRQSLLNESHAQYFWLSLLAVWFAEFYIRQVASGQWHDYVYLFGKGLSINPF